MNVLLTGATGYVGSNVLTALLAAGHEVLAVTRSESSAQQARETGAKAVVHDLTDTEWLVEQLGTVDAAIHTAATGDEQGPALDDAVVDAVVTAFAGTDKRYLHTSGIWIWGAGRVAEDGPLDPPAIVAWRIERENRVLSADVRATLIAPAIVYGHHSGIVAGVFGEGSRSQDGALRLIGSGDQHWTTVHVEDLADLYVAALTDGPRGRVAAASGHNPSVREIAQAVVGVDGVVLPETPDESRARLGAALADALLVDQQADGALARATWGWVPRRPSLLDDLAV
ncbi:NAD-dependent epimerase/dehydratase family protein [Cellulomonas sp. URHE0023]|uniref:NAD-dependent epimerase/dehydratase family protein n=1 Tax=Cellulomonas sp. URHE0023 TaxID=1380354 RepID=UPI0004845FAC|nr:NAD-dependent epimerase/dehydratase family protein [Cellulomonas sp. URHE0023]